jgi:hypothetical protein
METKMKILRNVLITSLIMSPFVSLVYSADDKVDMLSGKYGFSSNKKLLLNRQRVENVFNRAFNSTKGKSDQAKNAKKFISQVLLAVANKFDGPDKQQAFLKVLDDATTGRDLNVDIEKAKFSNTKPPTLIQVESAADLVFAALGLGDPTLDLLSRASDLKIKARTVDGKTVESLLTEYEAVKDTPAEAGKFLRGVDAMKFGESKRTLVEKVNARVAKHQTTGKYAAVGVDENDNNAIGAFHEAIRSAREEGAKDSHAAKKAGIALDFAAQIKSLFEDGILEAGEPIDFSTPAGYSRVLEILRTQGRKVTELQALLAKTIRR